MKLSQKAVAVFWLTGHKLVVLCLLQWLLVLAVCSFNLLATRAGRAALSSECLELHTCELAIISCLGVTLRCDWGVNVVARRRTSRCWEIWCSWSGSWSVMEIWCLLVQCARKSWRNVNISERNMRPANMWHCCRHINSLSSRSNNNNNNNNKNNNNNNNNNNYYYYYSVLDVHFYVHAVCMSVYLCVCVCACACVCVCVRCYRLTEFKSEQIAEQMTLLDAQLFQKIEVSLLCLSLIFFYVKMDFYGFCFLVLLPECCICCSLSLFYLLMSAIFSDVIIVADSWGAIMDSWAVRRTESKPH